MEIEEFDPSDLLYEGSGYSPVFDNENMYDESKETAKESTMESARESFAKNIRFVIPVIAGIILVVFGLTTTGSFFSPTGRFSGLLYSIWYEYQLGTLMAMIGTVIVYDSLKRKGYV